MKYLILVLLITVFTLSGYCMYTVWNRTVPYQDSSWISQEPPVTFALAYSPPTPPEPESTSTTIYPIDKTWRAFITNDGVFRFKYPTKGMYAPAWNHSYLPMNDPLMSGGCRTTEDLVPSYKLFFLEDRGYCLSTSYSEANGYTFRTDYVAIGMRKYYLLLTFKAQYPTDPFIQPACHLSKTARTCAPFHQDTYQKILEQMFETFEVK